MFLAGADISVVSVRERPIPKPRHNSKNISSQLSQDKETQNEGLALFHELYGRDKQSTDEHASFDDNLVCPSCCKQFRKGEIQKYKQHAAQCEKDKQRDVSIIIVTAC